VKAVKHEMASQGISTNQKIQDSAGSIMASVFCDSEAVIHVDFIPRGIIIKAQCYRNWPHQVIWKRRPGKLLKKIILLHDRTCPQKTH
jgi:hypothetical protein